MLNLLNRTLKIGSIGVFETINLQIHKLAHSIHLNSEVGVSFKLWNIGNTALTHTV
jgi:hypothetical protein